MFKYLKIKNYLFLISIFSLSAISFLLSYESISFRSYFNNYYLEYSEYFRSTLIGDKMTFNRTFPMWGYGFIHLFLKNEYLIVLSQLIINIITILLYENLIINPKKKIFFRLLVIFSLPLFFFHTQVWPKSFFSSFTLIGLYFLIKFINSKNILNLIYCGLFWGVANNLRSDYFYFFILISILLFSFYFLKSFDIKNSIKILLVPFLVFLLIVPWNIYFKDKTGEYSITSKNSGHVLFIGLGQLDNNIWGIKPIDNDSLMTKILKENGLNVDESVSIRGNKILLNEFFNLIVTNPYEYFRKCLNSIKLLFFDPFFIGNLGDFQNNKFGNIYELRKLESLLYSLNIKDSISLIYETDWKFKKYETLKLIITIITKIIGILVFLISIFTLFIKVYFVKKLNTVDFLIIIFILYQLSISIFAFHMPVYNSTIYLLYIFFISVNLKFNPIKYISKKNSYSG